MYGSNEYNDFLTNFNSKTTLPRRDEKIIYSQSPVEGSALP